MGQVGLGSSLEVCMWRCFLVIGLVACSNSAKESEDSDPVVDSGDTGDSGTTGDTDDSTPVPSPQITITAPEDGTTFPESSLELSYTVQDFQLDLSATPTEGVGHVNVYDNRVLVGATDQLTYALTGLTGQHVLEVRLAGNDDQELGVSDTVTVNSTAPMVTILSPAEGTALVGSSVEMEVSLSSFVFDPLGSGNQAGHGHLHVWVDGVFSDESVDAARVLATRMAEGSHTVKVELVQNDHTPVQEGGTCGVDNLSCAERTFVAGPLDLALAEVTSPYASATIPTNVSSANFFINKPSGSNVPGRGHLHIYVDGDFVAEGVDAYSFAYHVSAGPHILEVRAAANDHTELGVVDSRRIEVAADRTDVVIDSPLDGSTVDQFCPLSIHGDNFLLVDPTTNPNPTPGEGYYQVVVDQLFVYNGWDPSITADLLGSGPHIVHVELVTSDGNSVEPYVASEPITLTVP